MLWSTMCHSNNIHVNDASIMSEEGSEMGEIGEEGLVFIANTQGEIQIHPNKDVATGTTIDAFIKEKITDKLLCKAVRLAKFIFYLSAKIIDIYISAWNGA